MATYFESGVGKAISGSPLEMGKDAVSQALSHIKQFDPSLAIAFISPELDIPEVNRGMIEVLGDCPLIGSSTGGEIANRSLKNSVVVALLASPHIKVKVGIGKKVGQDFQKAVQEALTDADIGDYFTSKSPEHQMLNIAGRGSPGASPVLLFVFSPGTTSNQFSLSHDIHTMLRKDSANRIPIFGGSSADYFKYGPNYQIVNNCVATDSVAVALLETELLFGVGMAHGFVPTTLRTLVTRASGHFVHEFDERPAAEVYAEMLDIPLSRIDEILPTGPSPLNKNPFGSIDVYGNSLLHVPERILGDGSIQFPHLIGNNRIMTLMKADRLEMVESGVSAYEKAIKFGGLNKPSLVMMFSCALRLMGQEDQEEIRLLREKANLPICGFYTYGEKGVLDDGLPVYNNQSVSLLVFSDELNPVASLIHQGRRVYREFASRLDRKVSQIKSISRINQVIQDGKEVGRLLSALTEELSSLFPWAYGAFYLPADESGTYALACAKDPERFSRKISPDNGEKEYVSINLDSHGRRFGIMLLQMKTESPSPEEEDMVLAETIGKLTASGLYGIELDGRLESKMQQLEILNQLGHELAKSISTSSQSQNIIRYIRKTFELPYVSLWLVDRTHQVLTKEAMDQDSEMKIGAIEKENDERLARWQIENQQPLFFTKGSGERCPIDLVLPFSLSFITIPITYKKQVRGVLNLYSQKHYKWSLQSEPIIENIDFLQSISTQMAIFIENRSLHKHATFFKEIHHRVKNNLQNVASLLRLQLRRLDRIPAEQALNDSISRILSIALVHETLSQGEIGMVDLGQLIGRISKFSESDSSINFATTLDFSGPQVFVPSRTATSLALVINELVQNAIQHGFQHGDGGKLSIKFEQVGRAVSITIEDDGPGLPRDFKLDRDSNLGLTIVRTLIRDELKGQFTVDGNHGTRVEITFPVPEAYYGMK